MEEPRVGSRQNDTTTKRRSGKRTARACDECRMRKSKCDGLQPCESCQNTERYCTYNLSASKSTGSGTRIRILEDRLRRARAYLNEAQRRTPSLSDINFDALLGPTEDYARDDATKTGSGDDDDGSSDEKLDSMMTSYGQMTNNSQESMARDYYGAASGLAWLQRTKQFFSEKSTEENSDSRNPSISTSAAIQIFDAPLPPKNSYTIDEPVPRLLPPRAVATRLLDVVFTQVYPLFHFLDMDDFQISTTRIYELDPIEYEERDKAFLPLFWLVIGLGYLFSRDEHAKHGCKTAVAHAMRQFLAGRQLLDLAHLRTIVSLQSVICLILFLISTARIASAHAFVGVACAAAMRQGLHYRSNHETSIPERERHVRQRVFWAVIALDMYVSGILGLPAFVDLSAVDPAIDLTIEIALKEFREAKRGTVATRLSSAASAKHIELMRILKKAQAALYPRPNIPPESLDENPPIKVKVAKLREVEDQFQEWARSLSEIHAVPGTDEETISIKYEAQITYYFANVVLLRAFLHYLALEKEDPSAVGKRQLSYAKTCVKMASKVVSISINHQQQGLLCPASWPSVYTVFISVVCLLFAYAVRAGNTESKALRVDIENGIRLLASTACTTDTGSVRCLEILRRLIEKVSHKVTIDLDQICSDTKPCCAARFDSPSSGTDTTGLEQDDPIHINATTSQPPNNVAATSQTQWANMYDVNTFPTSVSNESAMNISTMAGISFRPAISAHDPAQDYYADEDMMEVTPYAQGYRWPAGATYEPTTGVNGQSSGENVALTASTPISRISAEDIDAFMRINPGDNPFNMAE